jgi:radical SAM superfamily enzyme YgiQ (UPF0313 family)
MEKKGKIKRAAFVYLTQESEVYFLGDDVGYSVQRRPQLGLQYLCAVLESTGINTSIFDQTIVPFDADWIINHLKDFDMVGFYCSDPQEEKVKSYCKKIRGKLSIPILVGGPSTLDNATFLEHGCDFVVHGEGEATIRQVVEYYDGIRKIEDVKGVSYRKDGSIFTSAPQDLIADLDTIPFPDRSKIDVNMYHDYFLFGMQKPYVTIMASRGCAYKCHFCTSYKLWGCRYRKRSVDNVLAEVDEVVKKYDAKYIAFQDDIFGLTNSWIEEFCTKLMKKPYKIRWMAILHPFSVKTDTEKMLKLMRRAGCDTLSFGLQAAHPVILQNINRNPEEPAALAKVLKVARKLKFITAVAYIFGLPGDTKETIQTTIDYSLRCGSTLANYFMLSVLRGSEIGEIYKNKKICELPASEIERLASYASKRFYSRPGTFLDVGYFIMKNPWWIAGVGRNLPSILKRVGFGKPQKKQEVS